MTNRNRIVFAVCCAAIGGGGIAVFLAGAHSHHHHRGEPSDVQTIAIGDLAFRNPRVRLPPPGAQVFAGYIDIVNNGEADNVLLGAESPIAEKTEIHATTHKDGVMKMRPLSRGLTLAANGGAAVLEPGGDHLMFFSPKRSLVVGEEIAVKLAFAGGQTLTVRFKAEKTSADKHEHKH